MTENLNALSKFLFKIWRDLNFFSEIWFSTCFSGSDWRFISTVNTNTNLLHRGKVEYNVWFRYSRQMYIWKLPCINSLLKLRGTASPQHTFFIKAMDRTLWSIKSGRSTVFLKIHFSENKRKNTLVKNRSLFFNHFVWAARIRRGMEIS